MVVLRLSFPEKPLYSFETKTKFGIIPSHPKTKPACKKLLKSTEPFVKYSQNVLTNRQKDR